MKLTEKLKEKLNKTKWQMLNNIFVDACSQGNFKLVEYLLLHPQLQYAIEINRNDGTLEPLTVAAWSGHLKIVKFLLTNENLLEKADFTTESNYSEKHQPLKQACYHNKASVVIFLIKNCYSKNKNLYKETMEKNCQDILERGKAYDVIDVFIKNSDLTGISINNILVYSAIFDNDITEYLIDKYNLDMNPKLLKFLNSIKNSVDVYDKKIYERLNRLFSSKILNETLEINLTKKEEIKNLKSKV